MTESTAFPTEDPTTTINHLRKRRNFWRDRAEKAERALCEWWADPDNPPTYAALVNANKAEWKTRGQEDDG